jgi:hypothetical protein
MTRHKSIERPPAGRSVHIEFDGQHYEATYTVDGPMITVETLMLGIKRAPLGDASPEALARLLLAELVHDNARRARQ